MNDIDHFSHDITMTFVFSLLAIAKKPLIVYITNNEEHHIQIESTFDTHQGKKKTKYLYFIDIIFRGSPVKGEEKRNH